MKYLRSNRAFGMLSTVMAMLIMAIGAVAFQKWMVNQIKMQRGIGSNIDLNEIRNNFHQMTIKPEYCARVGFIGVNISNLIAAYNSRIQSPQENIQTIPVPISLHIPGSIDSTVTASLGNYYRNINYFNIDSVAALGTNTYMAYLSMMTSPKGEMMASDKKLHFFLKVSVDNAGNIIQCSEGNPPLSQCPTESRQIGTLPDGTPECEKEFFYTIQYQQADRNVSGAAALQSPNAVLSCYFGCDYGTTPVSDLENGQGDIQSPCRLSAPPGWSVQADVIHAFSDNQCRFYHTAVDGSRIEDGQPEPQCGAFVIRCRQRSA